MKEKLIAKWVVTVPEGAEVQVKVGQKVEEGDLLLVWEQGKNERVSMLSVLSHFSKDRWQWVRDNFVGKKLVVGEELVSKDGLGGVKLLSPRSGVLVGLDEFGNMEFRQSTVREEVVAPMKSKVTKMEKEKIVLEFKAIEIKGEGVVDGKRWGECSFVSIERDIDLTFGNKGEVVMIPVLENYLVLKAEVVGALAVVTLESKCDNVGELPVLKIAKNDWDYLLGKIKSKRKVLVNSKAGRMLIVVE